MIMQYFKHSELVNRYHISLKTIHNWIDATKHNKLGLKLYEHRNRTYIANTTENIVLLEQLVEKGKKYRNSLHHKLVKPKAEFYDIYSPRQIIDIITNLEVFREIPRQYNYMKEGATNWDNWLERLSQEKTTNILKGTIEIIHFNLNAINRFIQDGKRINVIDLGVGNAFPVKELLGYLLEKGVIHRYIAVDISQSMLSIAERNVREWYGSKIRFEGHVKDISHERFDDLLTGDMLDDSADETINLVLLLGGTPINFRSYNDIFKVVYGSMGRNDLLIYTDKLDTEASRRYFDFSSHPSSSIQLGMNKLSPNHRYILDMLNIDESLYEVEAGFDKRKCMRYVRVRLKKSITIEFSFDKNRRSVELDKGDVILLLRIWHLTALETIAEFEKTGLMLLHSSLTKDRQFFLSISGVEAKGKLESE
jgi:SAM-dependent methyltransferase